MHESECGKSQEGIANGFQNSSSLCLVSSEHGQNLLICVSVGSP